MTTPAFVVGAFKSEGGCVFFFSSRRRHTRYWRDWSSDVCSSDLEGKLHGTQSNHFTIGVEHAGFASQTAWPVEQIDASARLVCEVARRWQIPRDRLRSEERRVGKECRSRWSPYH